MCFKLYKLKLLQALTASGKWKGEFCNNMQMKIKEGGFTDRLIFYTPDQWQDEQVQCPYLGNQAPTCNDREHQHDYEKLTSVCVTTHKKIHSPMNLQSLTTRFCTCLETSYYSNWIPTMVITSYNLTEHLSIFTEMYKGSELWPPMYGMS